MVDAVVARVGGELRLTLEGNPVTDGEMVRRQIADGLQENLETLARLALLRN